MSLGKTRTPPKKQFWVPSSLLKKDIQDLKILVSDYSHNGLEVFYRRCNQMPHMGHKRIQWNTKECIVLAI